VSRSFKLYLEDILQSGNKVLNFTANMTLEELVRDERTFDAVAHNLQIIGEATKNIPEEIRSQYPQVEWRKIAGLRDIIAHTYFSIDEEIIWDIIQNKLSILLEQIQNILLNWAEE
jgi:uncharacterized protein with HEPN domain